MTAYFVDTSALAKRYVSEIGSTWTRSWLHINTGNVILISELVRVEMFSLLHRYQRMNLFSKTSIGRMQSAFLAHFQLGYSVIALNEALIAEAANLATRHPLRALDCVQLASGLKASRSITSSVTFVSADSDLLTAAAA